MMMDLTELSSSRFIPDGNPKPKRKLKMGPAFWTITGIISLICNIVLIVVLYAVAGQLFTLKSLVENQLVSALYENFMLMDEAGIKAEIPVNADVPAQFDLPLETDTVVVLTEATHIYAESVSLYTGGLSIYDAPTDIILPAGTQLPVHLSLVVPVDQNIPVDLIVYVDIPLSQTDLHEPFQGLQFVVEP
ncbi:MAG: hypothetical protein MUO76_21335 [Anaerolineaceae bacterium]|nr:hypothetical protein [Anaerolineaceae bacterium]